MIIKAQLKGLEPGLLMNSLGGYGKGVPKEMRDKGIKDLKSWYEIDKAGAQMWEAENGAYRMSTPVEPGGKVHSFCVTQDVLWGCFLKGCSSMKVKIGGRSMSAKTVFASILAPTAFEFPIVDSSDVPLTKFTDTITKIVRIPPGPKGARVPKTWGRLYPWFCNFSLKTRTAVSRDALDKAREVFEQSGIFQGMMDGRPGLQHFNFGCFEVSKWVVCDDTGKPLDESALPAAEPEKTKKKKEASVPAAAGE
jgi:hypothetical protein